eukprot:335383_1
MMDMESRLQDLIKTQKAVKSKIVHDHHEVSRLSKQLDKSSGQMDHLIEQHKEEVSSLKHDYEQRIAKIHEAHREQIKTLENEMTLSTDDRKEEFEHQLRTVEEDRNDLRLSLAKSEAQVRQFKLSERQLLRENKALSEHQKASPSVADIMQINGKVSELTRLLHSQAVELKRTKSELVALQHDYKICLRANQMMDLELKSSRKSGRRLGSEFKKLKDEKRKTDKAVDSVKLLTQKLTDKFKGSVSELRTEFVGTVTELQAKIGRLKDECGSKDIELGQMRNQLQCYWETLETYNGSAAPPIRCSKFRRFLPNTLSLLTGPSKLK